MTDEDKDKDFTFGKIDDDFSNDDGWGKFDDQSDNGDFALDGETESKAPAPMDFGETVDDEKSHGLVDEPRTPSRAKRASTRMIYSGLLVMVLSAAGFYYFTTSPAPPEVKPEAPPLKQTLTMPERPEGGSVADAPEQAVPTQEGQVAVATAVPKGTLREIPPSSAPPEPIGSAWSGGGAPPATPPTTVVDREAPAMVTPVAPPKVEKVEKPEPLAKPAKTLPSAKPAPAAPESATLPKPTAKPAPVVVPPKPEPVAKPEKTVSGRGVYTIQAGAFAETGNRDQAMKKIRQLGYEAQTTPVTKTQAMTRLLIGVYAPDVARAKAKELKPRAPELFILKQGEQLAVYAGSFGDPGKAREATAELARQGVTVSEERAEVESTLWRLTFGGFADAATAKAAAAKAKAAGLEARVIRNP